MKKYILILVFLLKIVEINAQDSKNSLEIGTNADYYRHRINYGDLNFYKVMSLNAAYTHAFKHLLFKIDFSKSTWRSDINFLGYYIKRGRSRYYGVVFNNRDATVYNIGIAPKFLGRLKNTSLFFNISYRIYKDDYFAQGISYEPEFGGRDEKHLGIGIDLKQKFPLKHGFYAYTDAVYNRYFRKTTIGPSFASSLNNYFNVNLGVGYNF